MKRIIILIFVFLTSQILIGQVNLELKGMFIFGLNNYDRKNPRDSRAYQTRKILVNSMNQKMTFYGNGVGVNFHDNISRRYITNDFIEKSRFYYKIKNENQIFFRKKKDDPWKLFGEITNMTKSGHYFEIQIPDIPFTIGMYKVKKK